MHEYTLGSALRLDGLILYRYQVRPLAAAAVGDEVLGVALLCKGNDGVRCIEDRLGRAIVLRQCNDGRRRVVLTWKTENVAYRSRAKAVDRLRIISDHRHAAAIRLEKAKDRCLQGIGVLIFVDDDMVEQRGNLRGELGNAHHSGPIQEQVVEVEDLLRLFRRYVGAEQRTQFFLQSCAPWIAIAQHVGQRRLRVDRARIDRQTRGSPGEARFGFLAGELRVANQGHQVFGISPRGS